MMTAYPEVNPEWLILGKGRPYKSERSQPSGEQKIDLFTDFQESGTEADTPLSSEDHLFEDKKQEEQRVENRKIGFDLAAPQATSVKKIARIIVFFNDGTYEEK